MNVSLVALLACAVFVMMMLGVGAVMIQRLRNRSDDEWAVGR